MPYNYPVTKSNNYRRRRNYRKKQPSRYEVYSKAGTQLWNDVKKLKELINVEFKVKDVLFTSIPMIQTVDLTLLNGIAQGDDDDDREGDSVRFKSIQFNGQISFVSADSNVRLIWFIDTQPYAATPAYTDLLVSNGGGIMPTVALRNLANRTRFIILKDQTFKSNAAYNPTIPIEWYRKMDMKTFYTGSNSTISDIQTHALYLMSFSDIADANTANAPVLNGISRLRYIDN